LKIEFKQKLKVESGRKFVTLPKDITESHTDILNEWERVKKLRAARREGRLPSKVFIDDLPDNYAVDTSGFLAKVTIQV